MVEGKTFQWTELWVVHITIYSVWKEKQSEVSICRCSPTNSNRHHLPPEFSEWSPNLSPCFNLPPVLFVNGAAWVMILLQHWTPPFETHQMAFRIFIAVSGHYMMWPSLWAHVQSCRALLIRFGFSSLTFSLALPTSNHRASVLIIILSRRPEALSLLKHMHIYLSSTL